MNNPRDRVGGAVRVVRERHPVEHDHLGDALGSDRTGTVSDSDHRHAGRDHAARPP